jgi:hypothetical protein
VDYLMNQGHHDIACITAPIHTPTGKARLMGYRKALEKHGICWDPAKVKYGDSSMSRGYELCQEILHEGIKVSALFACNDDMALGLQRRCIRRGYVFRRIFLCLVSMTHPAPVGWSRGCRRFIPIDTMITTAIDQAVRLATKRRSKRSRLLPAPWCCVIPSPRAIFPG